MKKTNIISLFAGSGCGKSTTAAGLFYQMKQQGLDAELVTEYVKTWAWEGKKINKYDQIYIFGKQFKRESTLYGKVDYIITDSPILLSPIYEEFYSGSSVVQSAALELISRAEQDGISRYNFFLKRNKPFKQEGRYETEETAKQVDQFVLKKMDNYNQPLIQLNSDDANVVQDIFNYVTKTKE